MDVEDEDLRGVEPAGPEITAVVGESRVMRLVAPAYRKRMHHLAVVRRVGVDVHGDELVLPVPEPLDPKCPDVDEVLLTDDLRHVR